MEGLGDVIKNTKEQRKQRKKIKLSGKSEIKINPELELGIASGGNNVGSGSSLN